MFKIMDRLWQSSGMELNMLCYGIMESGDMTGYIEFVPDSITISEIHIDSGTWMGAFRRNSIL